MTEKGNKAKAGGKKPYHGVVVPMVTPVTADEKLDEPATRRVIEHLIAGGVHGVFVLGTTGEAASISSKMGQKLVDVTVDQVGGRVVTYAGIGGNCLTDSVDAAEAYFRQGMAAVVAHLPSYYPLSPEEQFKYYTTLADRIPGPLMLYNIPKTTHLSIPVDVIAHLSGHPNIVGVKDSENDRDRLRALMQAVGKRSDFTVFVGVSALSQEALFLGADGTVPSPAHLAPELCVNLYKLAREGDVAGAKVCQAQLNEVAALYTENRTLGQSLAALKAALGELSLCGPSMLPPLHALSGAEQASLRRDYRHWKAKLAS